VDIFLLRFLAEPAYLEGLSLQSRPSRTIVVETRSFIVHAILQQAQLVTLLEETLSQFGGIVSQTYLRGRDDFQRLVIRSANYVVIVDRMKARQFYEAIQELDSAEIRVSVDSPDPEVLGEQV